MWVMPAISLQKTRGNMTTPKVRTFLNPYSVTEHRIHLFSVIEVYLTRADAESESGGIACSRVSATDSTAESTTNSSGREPASPTKRTSNHKSKFTYTDNSRTGAHQSIRNFFSQCDLDHASTPCDRKSIKRLI